MDGDDGAPEPIARASALNLVATVFELVAHVFGEGAGVNYCCMKVLNPAVKWVCTVVRSSVL